MWSLRVNAHSSFEVLHEKCYPITSLQMLTVRVLPHATWSEPKWKVPVTAQSVCLLCHCSVSLDLGGWFQRQAKLSEKINF